MRSIAETHSDSEILSAREQTTEQLEADLTEVNGAQLLAEQEYRTRAQNRVGKVEGREVWMQVERAKYEEPRAKRRVGTELSLVGLASQGRMRKTKIQV
jgi:hypothetical protein